MGAELSEFPVTGEYANHRAFWVLVVEASNDGLYDKQNGFTSTVAEV